MIVNHNEPVHIRTVDRLFIYWFEYKELSSLMNWKEKWNRPMLNIKNIVILFLVSVECIAFVHVSKIGNLIEYNEKMCTVIYHLLCKKIT